MTGLLNVFGLSLRILAVNDHVTNAAHMAAELAEE
jgi:hypothetical protein